MKYTILILASLIVLFNSCSDDCDAPAFSENIIGLWIGTSIGQSGRMEFNTDGTLVDQDDFLVSGEAGGVTLDEKSWTVDGDKLTVKAEKDAQFVSVEYDILENNCDIVTLELLGVSLELSRQ